MPLKRNPPIEHLPRQVTNLQSKNCLAAFQFRFGDCTARTFTEVTELLDSLLDTGEPPPFVI